MGPPIEFALLAKIMSAVNLLVFVFAICGSALVWFSYDFRIGNSEISIAMSLYKVSIPCLGAVDRETARLLLSHETDRTFLTKLQTSRVREDVNDDQYNYDKNVNIDLLDDDNGGAGTIAMSRMSSILLIIFGVGMSMVSLQPLSSSTAPLVDGILYKQTHSETLESPLPLLQDPLPSSQ